MSHEFNNYLYVMTADGQDTPCKVGLSCNPERRAKQMSVGSGVPLVVRHVAKINGPQPKFGSSRPYFFANRFGREVETLAHKNMAGRRKKSEWFDVHYSHAVAVVDEAVKTNGYAV